MDRDQDAAAKRDAPSKAGIVVPFKDKLWVAIDTLIAAVWADELDQLFRQAAKTGLSARHARRIDHSL